MRFLLAVVPLAITSAAHAQLISVKTIPMAQADQFDIFPSRTAGMGSVGIALPDTILDMVGNPALGARLSSARFFSAPSLYSITQNMGAGRSLPMGSVARAGSWFGGFSAAVQEIDPHGRFGAATPTLLDFQGDPVPSGNTSHGNKILFASMGKSLAGKGLSVGGSLFWSEVRGIDGVDQLYGNSVSVEQFGHIVDGRLGILREWENGSSLNAVAVYNRYAMAHDVTFADVIWNPATLTTFQQGRVTHNLDHTNTLGAQIGYQRALLTSGLRVGGVVAVNRLTHPKIPEFEVTQANTRTVVPIPWDPGFTHAFRLGAGVARVAGASSFGAEVVLEPMLTHTWGEAQAPIVTSGGATIPAGGRTVENWFHFLNSTLRVGAEQAIWPSAVFQFGVDVHTVHYRFWQNDRVQNVGRSQVVGWTEYAPTWGLRFRFPEMEVSYQGRVSKGAGRPGASRSGGGPDISFLNQADGGAIVAPPGESTDMGNVNLFTHRITLSIPLGPSPRKRSRE